MKVLSKIFTLLIFISMAGFAIENENNTKIKVKCYVELFGGKRTIVYHMVKENKLNILSQGLNNKSFMTTLSDKKQKIYQVLECVPNENVFKNINAIAVEKVTAR
jgi:lipid-A-disaccharide synthase-like uncharacterized protein